MKTAEEWIDSLGISGTADLQRGGAVRIGEKVAIMNRDNIASVQRDAYKQGREDTMKWVSQFCKDQTERLVALRFQETPKI